MKKRNSGRVLVGVGLLCVLGALLVAVGVAFAADMGQDKVWRLGEVFSSKLDDDLITGTVNLAASSAQYTLPKAGDPYLVCAHGNRAFVLCGSNPTAVATAGSYTFSVPSGSCLGPLRLTGPKCAHIAATATGQIEFLRFDPSL